MEKVHDEMANSSSAKSCCGKRRCVVLLLESKKAIFDCLKAGAMREKLADEYRIGRSNVGDIQKNKDKMRSFVSRWKAWL